MMDLTVCDIIVSCGVSCPKGLHVCRLSKKISSHDGVGDHRKKIFHLMMKNFHLLMALVIDKNFILLKKLSPHDGVGKIQLFSTLHVGGYFRF